jgi:thiamine-phosphate pyrophosphorylase
VKLIVFTGPTLIPNEEKAITTLFQNDLEFLHLRKPDFSENELIRFTEKIPVEFHHRIIIHQHFKLVKKFDFKGIHLNLVNRIFYEELKTENIKILSTSCHSFSEIIENQGKFEYIFLSPIFDSISKNGYSSAFSREELLNAKNQNIINDKIIALGGINLENIKTLIDFGFGGVGVLGNLWNYFTNESNIDSLVKQFIKLKEAVVI